MRDIVIRTDASSQMGSGHVMRCLVLAEALKGQGANVHFACSPLPGNLIQLIEGKGFPVVAVPENELEPSLNDNRHESATSKQENDSWIQEFYAQNTRKPVLIIDHYTANLVYEQSMRLYSHKLFVIDDLAREHECDALLDQNAFFGQLHRYTGKVPANATSFLGPEYVLLAQPFRITALPRLTNTRIGKLLVTFGGSDPGNMTGRIATLLSNVPGDLPEITVIHGQNAPDKERIKALCSSMKWTYYESVTQQRLAELLLEHDLVIGAGGTSVWERAALHTPSLCIAIAENQEPILEYLHEERHLTYIGRQDDVTDDELLHVVREVLQEGVSFKPLEVGNKTHECVQWLITAAGE